MRQVRKTSATRQASVLPTFVGGQRGEHTLSAEKSSITKERIGMAFFADLTPYAYLRGSFTEGRDALNVGWLEVNELFPTGPVPGTVVTRLQELIQHPVNECRGFHICPWCWRSDHLTPRDTWGNGEIRVTGADGAVYAAPVLIAHYIEAHQYQPPAAFIEAVLA